MTALIERGNLLGCTDPGEQCFKWMLSLLLMCHYDTLPGPWPIYYKLQDLKQAAAAERKSYPLEQLTQYPSNPEDLLKEIYNYAYTDSQPITVEMAGIHTVSEKIPLRRNSRLLRQPGSSTAGTSKSGKQTPAQKGLRDDDSPLISNPDIAASPVGSCHVGSNDMPDPTDNIEQGLYATYKADLWKHRAKKKGLLGAPGASQQPSASIAGAVPLKVEHDGSLTLTPRVGVTMQCDMPVTPKTESVQIKAEPMDMPVTPKTESVQTKAEPKSEGEPETGAGLDAYAIAALEAMGKRNV